MNRFKRNRCFLEVEALEDRNTPSANLGEMPLTALDGLANAADHNESSQAGHSALFANDSAAEEGDDESLPPASDHGTDNAASHNGSSQANHAPVFNTDGAAPVVPPPLPAAAGKGIDNASTHNATSQAPNHSHRMGAFRPPHANGGNGGTPTSPDAATKGLANAALHNAGSQAAIHSHVFRH